MDDDDGDGDVDDGWARLASAENAEKMATGAEKVIGDGSDRRINQMRDWVIFGSK